MPKLLVDGVNIYHEVNGAGAPFIMSHGFVGTTRMWEKQVAAFSQRYRFITYDIRGHGQSDAPRDLSRYTLETAVNDIYQLLKGLGVDKAVVGGLSLGGFLSLAFYKAHPEMVRALILCDTGPGYRTPEKAHPWMEDCIKRAELLEKGGMKAFADSPYATSDYYTPRDLMLKMDPIGCANVSRGVMANALGIIEVLEKITAPTLLVCGERDTDFIPATEYMHARIKGSERLIVPNAGHGVNIDQPEVFNRAVLGFLKRNTI
ncbi:MAG: alpha/beta fold hydrolase [Chloroflexi bacterium]|nr:alpha/beta fold hydrolase [Chloroflexota bacterium]